MSNKQVFPCKYPREVFDAKTSTEKTTRTFSLNAMFFPASINTPVENPNKVAKPYYVYQEPFSRLVATIVVKANGKTQAIAKGNIPVDYIASLFKDADHARQVDIEMQVWGRKIEKQIAILIQKVDKLMEAVTNGFKGQKAALNAMFYYMQHGRLPQKEEAAGGTGNNGQNSAQNNTQNNVQAGLFEQRAKEKEALYKKAAGTILKTGIFKDKTPFGYLTESSSSSILEKVSALEKQKNFLNDNLAKYPKNAEQIEAIEAAVDYYKKGYYEEEGGSQIEVNAYEPPEQEGMSEYVLLKAEPKPNIYTEPGEDGRSHVYEISAKYIFGYRYPIQFQITEYRAPVTRQANGSINVHQKDAVDRQTETVNLSWKDFANLMRRVETHMRRFENVYAVKQLTEADTAERQNIERTKASKSGT